MRSKLRVFAVVAGCGLAVACSSGTPKLTISCANPSGTAELTWPDGGVWSYTFGPDCAALNSGDGVHHNLVDPSSKCTSPQAQAAIQSGNAQYLFSQIDAVMGGSSDSFTPSMSLTTVAWTGDLFSSPPPAGKVAVTLDEWVDPSDLDLNHPVQAGQTVTLKRYGFPDKAVDQATIERVGDGLNTEDGTTLSFDCSIEVVSTPPATRRMLRGVRT